ncbi:MAG: prepilin peptidase [Clostridia bacterium]|nr:prepilin peptidase [Clostridia bacterium]
MWTHNVVIFLFGLVIGSFLNVCIARIPKKASIAYPPSHCTDCDTRLKVSDLVPVFSYIRLKGKCRYCGSKISLVYPLVEITTGILFTLIYIKTGLSAKLIPGLIFVCILIIASFIDIEHFIVPDILPIVLSVSAFIMNFAGINIDVLYGIYGGALGGGVVLAIAYLSLMIFKKEGMGGGDLKIMTSIGLFLGLKLTAIALLLSVYSGAIAGIFILLGKGKQKRYMPFVPFISIGSIISYLYGDRIISWYIGTFLV